LIHDREKMRGKIISIVLITLTIIAVIGVGIYEYELQLQKPEYTAVISYSPYTPPGIPNIKNVTLAGLFWTLKSGNYTFVLLNTQNLKNYFSYFSMTITIYSSSPTPVANLTLSYPNNTKVTVYLPAGSYGMDVRFNYRLLNNVTNVTMKFPLVMIKYGSRNYWELKADITI